MQNLKKSKRGSVIVFWAILLPVLLGLAGLVIDIGTIYADRTRIQHIADSAALAGAARIKHDNEATALANAYITANQANAKNITITFPVVDKVKRIRVEITRHSPTYFLRIFNLDGMDITVHAAATGFNQPFNPLDYAIISDGNNDFNLLGNSGSHNTTIIGGVYSGATDFYFDNGSGATHDGQKIDGTIYTPNSDMIHYIDEAHPHNERFKDQVMTEADKINLKESDDISNFIKENVANNGDIQDLYNLTSADISNMTNLYSSEHPCYANSSEVDFSKLNGPLFVDGNFNKSVLISGTNSFSNTDKIVIVATGDINITGGTKIPAGHEVVLISLNGNVTYDGSVGSDPKNKGILKIVAPNGDITFNGGDVFMEGFLLGHHVSTGQNGTLYLENPTSSSNSTGAKSQLKLVE